MNAFAQLYYYYYTSGNRNVKNYSVICRIKKEIIHNYYFYIDKQGIME